MEPVTIPPTRTSAENGAPGRRSPKPRWWNKRQKVSRIALGVLLLLLVAWAAYFAHVAYEIWIRPPTAYLFALDPKSEITESLALELTRRAVELDGAKSTGLQPVRFREGNPDKMDLYWQRESAEGSPAVGHVRWRSTKWEYWVELEQEPGQARCTVSKLE